MQLLHRLAPTALNTQNWAAELDRTLASAALPPEAQARQRIDGLLAQAGWTVQDRSALNLTAGPGLAVRELPTAGGEADSGLFVNQQLGGVVEAGALELIKALRPAARGAWDE